MSEGRSLACDRRFRWISSVTGDPEALNELHARMQRFYSVAEERHRYQEMLDQAEGISLSETSVRHLMPAYVSALRPGAVIEIGCGSGRLYRQLREYGFKGAYAGIELSEALIRQNRFRHPDAEWRAVSVYDLPYGDDTFDVCLSLYVLEHLVYPARALEEMLRVVRPGGEVVLVFPDSVASGRLSSQLTGWSVGTTREKLRHGKWLDGLVTLYDNRVRLPKALRSASARYGPFPVNTRPICLAYPEIMQPDVDQTYIASKREVQRWAESRGCGVTYPAGTEGELAEQAFMVLHKRFAS